MHSAENVWTDLRKYLFSLFIIMQEQSERSAVQLICMGGAS